MAIDSDEVSSPLPTQGADAGPRMAVSSRTIMFGVAVAGVAGVLVATFRYGMGLTPDSVTYINGARSLSAGAGYTANGHAISDFPPGYSWMLSLGEHVGIDAEPHDVLPKGVLDAYGDDELTRAGAFRVYRDAAELRASLDEIGVLN